VKIQQAQLDAISARLRADFEDRLQRHLCESYPDTIGAMPPAVRLASVRLWIGRAEGYGIVLQDDIRRFAELWAGHGDSMETDPERPWIGTTLRRSDLDGTEKMDLLDALETSVAGEAE